MLERVGMDTVYIRQCLGMDACRGVSGQCSTGRQRAPYHLAIKLLAVPCQSTYVCTAYPHASNRTSRDHDRVVVAGRADNSVRSA